MNAKKYNGIDEVTYKNLEDDVDKFASNHNSRWIPYEYVDTILDKWARANCIELYGYDIEDDGFDQLLNIVNLKERHYLEEQKGELKTICLVHAQ